MDNDGSSATGRIGEALIFRMIQDEIYANKRADVSQVHLPEVQPLTNEQDQKLFAQLAQTIRKIAAEVEKNQTIIHQINSAARLGFKKVFPRLVKAVFNDGEINFARIVVLFYAVGKLAVKMVLANLRNEFSEMLDSCLEYFKKKLLAWIINMGGWICSFSALTQFSIEQTSASSRCTIPFPAVLLTTFTCGILIGGVIVWKVKTSG